MTQPLNEHVRVEAFNGVLVLNLLDKQLRGDKLAEELREQLLALVDETGGQRLIVNFQHVDYVFSVAFRPLLSLRRRLQETGGRMVFCNLAPAVVEVFAVVRLISQDGSFQAPFAVQADVAAALASFQA